MFYSKYCIENLIFFPRSVTIHDFRTLSTWH